jgi:hypothetical protein
MYVSLPGTYLPNTLRISVRRGLEFSHVVTPDHWCSVSYSLQNPTSQPIFYRTTTTSGVIQAQGQTTTGIYPAPVQFTRFVNQYNYRNWCTYAASVKRTFIVLTSDGNRFVAGTIVVPANRSLSTPSPLIAQSNLKQVQEIFMYNPKSAEFDLGGTNDSPYTVIESNYRIADEFGISDADLYIKSFGECNGAVYNYGEGGNTAGQTQNSFECFLYDTVRPYSFQPNVDTPQMLEAFTYAATYSVVERLEIVYHMVCWNDDIDPQKAVGAMQEEAQPSMEFSEDEPSYTMSQIREMIGNVQVSAQRAQENRQ